MKQHKKNLKKLTKKQLIKQVLIGIELNAQQSLKEGDRYNDLYDKYQICEAELIRVENELEETQEALRRNRNLLESYKHFESLFVVEQLTSTVLEKCLNSAGSTIHMYENMSVLQFLIKKYK